MSRVKATVITIRNITPTIIELVLARRDGREFFDFLPGQYATLSFPTYTRLKGERSFSIVSAPTDRTALHFGIRIAGRYTKALRNLRVGDPVLVAGPFGQFTFNPELDHSIVLLAGGIGVTPFLSMIQTAADLQLYNNLTLFYSIRSFEEAAYREELSALELNNPQFHTVYSVADGEIPAGSANMFPGRISRDLVAQAFNGDVRDRTYFLCGPTPFMKAMTDMLRSMGVPLPALKTERFGIGSRSFIERGTPVPKYVFAAWGITAMVLFGVVFRVEQNKRALSAAANPPVSNSITTPINSAPSTVVPSQPSTPSTVTPPPVQRRAPVVVPRTTVS